MGVLRIVTLVAAGLMAALALRQIMPGLKQAKARVRPTDHAARPACKLRQDPRTGIYYPED
jgi:hypothetical protein